MTSSNVDRVLFSVGSVLRGDDAAGPMLAKMMEEDETWHVVDGGQMPEDETGYLKRLSPRLIVMVDAADMGLPVGTVRRLTSNDIATTYLTTTHSLPISFLLEKIQSFCDEVIFLGIQPGATEFFSALSPEVMEAVESLKETLSKPEETWDFPMI